MGSFGSDSAYWLCTSWLCLDSRRADFLVADTCGDLRGSRRGVGEAQDARHFILSTYYRVRHESYVSSIDALRQRWCNCHEIRTFRSKVSEVIESENGAADTWLSMRPDAYPVHFSTNPFSVRFRTDSTDTNDCIKLESANPTHAIVHTEATESIRIAIVSALVDQNSHDIFLFLLLTQRLAHRWRPAIGCPIGGARRRAAIR